jgi:hypothetical protein
MVSSDPLRRLCWLVSLALAERAHPISGRRMGSGQLLEGDELECGHARECGSPVEEAASVHAYGLSQPFGASRDHLGVVRLPEQQVDRPACVVT